MGLQEPTLFKLFLVTEQEIGSINPCSFSATSELRMKPDNPRSTWKINWVVIPILQCHQFYIIQGYHLYLPGLCIADVNWNNASDFTLSLCYETRLSSSQESYYLVLLSKDYCSIRWKDVVSSSILYPWELTCQSCETW